MKKPEATKYERRREAYRGASLIVCRTVSGALGKAWSDGREIASLTGTSEDSVLELLCARVDASITLEVERDAVPYPDQQAYGRALAWHAKSVGAKNRLMLTAHRKAPACTLSGEALAEVSGCRSWASARTQYSLLGRMLAEAMLFQPFDRVQGSPMWLSMLAVPDREQSLGADTRWQMRPQLAAALVQVGGF
ncbi:MAG: hypothetical protein K2Y51_10915 [Gammaproteobacteria bacterium]|jgi:hypothetical protein|nr:hypothetical protein [Gammaproteobacteria bacterium]